MLYPTFFFFVTEDNSLPPIRFLSHSDNSTNTKREYATTLPKNWSYK